MEPKLTRRDFLKSMAAFSLAPLIEKMRRAGLRQRSLTPAGDFPNVIIFLFDALSAANSSLYGYPRRTTPNLDKFAQNATVYHAHYAAGSYTTPSTASFFTSTYPWTHRVFHMYSPVARNVKGNNLFRSMGEQPAYFRLAYAQNLLADGLLHQFGEYLDEHLDSGSFSLVNQTIHHALFKKDGFFGLKGVDDALLSYQDKQPAGSLVFSLINKLVMFARYKAYSRKYADSYPRGISSIIDNIHFILEPVIDGTMGLIDGLPTPSLAYFHYFFPHAPYVAKKEFVDKFLDDGWQPTEKAAHPLSSKLSEQFILNMRRAYDEYVASVDDEFGRLLSHMQASGLLDSSYIIVTSDHGEIFERGDVGHDSRLLYEPLIRIPLIVSKPRQQSRQDNFAPTNTIDLLPTLLHITGHSVPDWCEGQVLPGLGGEEQPDRSIYSVYPYPNPANAPLETVSVAIIRGEYKLICLRGYEGRDRYEFYNLKQDPEELVDLYSANNSVAQELRAELEHKLEDADQPYRRTSHE
jgi:arylsulfatase A-like enzyme